MEGMSQSYREFIRANGYTLTSERMPPRDTPLECVYIENASQSIRTTSATLGLANSATRCSECGVTEALISGSSAFISSLAWRVDQPIQ
ncbi:hypothetical protein [Kushneria aurantia]|uniref:Uncharacterized protein n=1 Tax=Kushneria aurantia TaxID=504092 RepID=A0ABV6G2L9_9GAMM|nr:hypothetical protein [Kushneria aurantia]